MGFEMVKDWLDKCEENKIKPWLYDFKTENLIVGEQNENAILRIFEWYTNDLQKYQIGEIENTILAKEIYCSLWNINRDLIFNKSNTRPYVDIDVMNSFWNIYKQDISINYNKKMTKWIEVEDKKTKRIILKINTESIGDLTTNYSFYEDTNKRLIKFSERTHTIGNFVIEPRGFNMGRQNNDYWDLGLLILQGFFQCLTDGEKNWKDYIDKYFLQSYINNDKEYSIAEFWKRKNDRVSPNTISEIEEFLSKVNWCIEERGKLMIKKLCEDNNLLHYSFYKNDLEGLKIKYSNDYRLERERK